MMLDKLDEDAKRRRRVILSALVLGALALAFFISAFFSLANRL